MSNLENKKFYDWIFSLYPTRWNNSSHPRGYHGIDIQILELLSEFKKQNIRLIDLGCGNGRTLECVYRRNWKLYGVDFSEYAIIEARQRIQPQINLLIADFTQLPFKNDSFDVVLSIGVHEHIDPIDFSEIARILTNNGKAFIYLPIVEKSIGKNYTNTCYNKDMDDWGKHFQWDLSHEEWKIELQKSLKILDFKEGFFICSKGE